MIATLVRVKTKAPEASFVFRVKVTRQTTRHTHPLSSAIWNACAENRRVTDPDIVCPVQAFVAGKSPFKQIHQYVRETSGKWRVCGRA